MSIYYCWVGDHMCDDDHNPMCQSNDGKAMCDECRCEIMEKEEENE